MQVLICVILAYNCEGTWDRFQPSFLFLPLEFFFSRWVCYFLKINHSSDHVIQCVSLLTVNSHKSAVIFEKWGLNLEYKFTNPSSDQTFFFWFLVWETIQGIYCTSAVALWPKICHFHLLLDFFMCVIFTFSRTLLFVAFFSPRKLDICSLNKR